MLGERDVSVLCVLSHSERAASTIVAWTRVLSRTVASMSHHSFDHFETVVHALRCLIERITLHQTIPRERVDVPVPRHLEEHVGTARKGVLNVQTTMEMNLFLFLVDGGGCGG